MEPCRQEASVQPLPIIFQTVPLPTTLINGGRSASGGFWQGRLSDRALRTVKEYDEKLEYIHLNPVKAGLVGRAQDWGWSSVNDYSGMSAAEQMRRCGLTIASLPLDSQARI